MRHRLDRLVCQLPATPARRACVDGTAVREANERGQREETRQGARTDRHAPTPPHAQQRVALPMRAVLTVVRVVGLRRARCGRGGQRTRATLRRAPSATALAHRTHTYNSPAIRPTRHHTCTTPTHAYTHPHRHHHDLRNIQRRHVGAALRHRLDRLVCQVRATPACRAWAQGGCSARPARGEHRLHLVECRLHHALQLCASTPGGEQRGWASVGSGAD